MLTQLEPQQAGLRALPASASSSLPPGQRVRLAYILAASHSGSTLLALLLGAHPDACTVGEMKGIGGHPGVYRCSCGALIKECAFWQRVNAAMAQRGLEFDITEAGTNHQKVQSRHLRRLLDPLHRGPALEFVRDLCLRAMPGWAPHLKRVQRRNAALAASLLEVSGAKVVVDSSKVGVRLKYLLRNRDLEVRVLRLIRDGRGVALTHTNPAEFADANDPRFRGGGAGGPGYVGLSMRAAARLWRRSNEEADEVVASLGQSACLEVRYEELCRRPDETLQSICRFLGILALPVGENFRARKTQHVVGNGMRFDASSEIRLDERWKTKLSSEDLGEFDRVAGTLNRAYGYA